MNPPHARFCLACAAPLAADLAPAPYVRKTVTALFCDLTSSAELGERLDPETMRRVVFRYFDEMRSVLERHGGTVEKFAGDSVMAIFGVPTVHEDDALRAVRAADEMQQALDRLNVELEAAWGVRLEIHIGINTGEVVASDTIQDQTVATGDPINLAARLQQAAGPGEVLLGKETYRLVKHAIDAGPLEAFKVKGKSQPVEPWRLNEVLTGAPRFRRQESQFVGREHVLSLVAGLYDTAVTNRRCRLVTILGPPGVGKSRLVDEFSSRLLGARVLWGRCQPYGEGITYWPVAEIVKRAAGIVDDDLPETAGERIVALLPPGGDTETISRAIMAATGLAPGSVRTEEAFWALRKLFESLAARHPLVLVFEDVHWAESTLLDLLEYLAERLAATPALLVCLARPELLEERPSWPVERSEMTMIPLEPLADDETSELISSLLGSEPVAEELERRITESAEGNPLFVEEFLGMLVDAGALERKDGAWSVKSGASTESVPPSIYAVLSARLDRLPSGERDLLQRASVVGRQFGWSAVSELSPVELRGNIGPRLQSLVRKGLVVRDEAAGFPGEDGFRFSHALVADAAYRTLPKELRAELHRRYADWLNERAGARAAEYEEILGYHGEQAWEARAQLGPEDEETRALGRRAAALLGSAGRRAFARGDMPGAVRLLMRATVLLRDEEPLRLDLAPDLAVALMETGELAQAEGVLAHAIDSADPAIRARARIVQAYVMFRSHPEQAGDDATRVGQEAIATFAERGDNRGLAHAWRLLAFTHIRRAQWHAAAEFLEPALEHAERAGDARERASALSWLASAHYFGPTPVDEAIRRCREIVEEAADDRALAAATAGYLAGLVAMRGNFEEARELALDSVEVFADLGVIRWQTSVRNHVALVELLAGNPRAAADELKWVRDALEEIGDRAGAVSASFELAEALCALGAFEEAEAVLPSNDDGARETDVMTAVTAHRVRARLDVHAGRLADAKQLASRAVQIADATDGLDMRAGAWLVLAEVLRAQGRSTPARFAARTALRLYEAKGNVVAAESARGLIDSSIPSRSSMTGSGSAGSAGGR